MDVSNAVPAAMAVGATEILRPAAKHAVQRARRPIPGDFLTYAPGRSYSALCKQYGAGYKTVVSWLDQAQMPRPAHDASRWPAPADFVERCATMHRAQIMRHYQASEHCIRRWIAETVVAPLPAPARIHVSRKPPADFGAVAPLRTREQLRTHYTVSAGTLARWIKHTGIQPKWAPGSWRAGPASSIGPMIGASTAAQAAQFLRRFRSNVFSIDILPARERSHLPNKGLGMWLVAGKGSITAEVLIAMAEAKGFDRHAWARI